MTLNRMEQLLQILLWKIFDKVWGEMSCLAIIQINQLLPGKTHHTESVKQA